MRTNSFRSRLTIRVLTVAATCPQPPPLKNGITTSRTVRGSEHAEFQCNQGYQLRGSAVIDCIRGKWRGAVPACIGRSVVFISLWYIINRPNGLASQWLI